MRWWTRSYATVSFHSRSEAATVQRRSAILLPESYGRCGRVNELHRQDHSNWDLLQPGVLALEAELTLQKTLRRYR
eukprot:jgi/Botrbrau1/11172/Bobra.182_2s0025.1